jgi:hypothetical protein
MLAGLTGYVIRGGKPGFDRLALLASERRADTRALLERAGISAGMRCIDVGWGGGKVPMEIARLVAPGGTIVGVDADQVKIALARQTAAERRLSNVEFIALDVRDWDEPGRLLRGGLEVPAAAPERASEPARPHVGRGRRRRGPDRGRRRLRRWCCDPPDEGFELFLDTYRRVLARRGGDHAIGRKLYRYFLAAGISSPQVSAVQPVHEGEAKTLAWSTLEATADSVIAEGLATRDQVTAGLASLRRLTDDPSTLISGRESSSSGPAGNQTGGLATALGRDGASPPARQPQD